MEPKKKKAKTKEKCQDCVNIEQHPLWGHTLCSYHRECSGNDDWQPEFCTKCRRQKRFLSELTVEEKKEYFQEMFTMLENTKRFKLQTVKVDWDYMEMLGIFMDESEFSQFLPQNKDANTKQKHGNKNKDANARQKHGNNTRQLDDRDDARATTAEYDDPYNEEEEDDCYPDLQDEYYVDNYEDGQENNQNFNQDQNFNLNSENNYNNDNPVDFQVNMQYNEFPHPQIPINFQNLPFQQTNNNSQNFGNPNFYDMQYRSPQPFSMPAPATQFYPLHSQFYGGPPQRAHEIDPITGETWLYFDPIYHSKKGNNKMQMWTHEGPKIVNVQYRIGNPNMFKTINTTAANNPNPYMDGREGHAVLLTSFDRNVSSNSFGNAQRVPFETRLESGSGLAQTLDLIKRKDSEISIALFDNNTKDLLDQFPRTVFEPMTVADFTSGWNLTSSSFVAFAKDRELNIRTVNIQLNVNYNFSVPKILLVRERDTRRRMINSMTSMHCIDLLGDKIDSIDEQVKRATRLSSLQTKAIGRTMLPNFKNDVILWKRAKMNLRKAVLKNHKHSNNLRLLRSSLWCEELFPNDITQELVTHGGRNMAPLLGLGDFASSSTSFQQRSNKNIPQKSNNNYFQQPKYQQSNQTFRDNHKGSPQRQQNNQRQSNTTQETKNSSNGNYVPSGDKQQGEQRTRSRGRGRGRGRSSYTRPTTSYNKDSQNK